MFDQILGGEASLFLRFAVAFGIVLSLIALTFVGIRRFAGRRLPLSNMGRARQPRLGVLDAFAIDARRRLVLIRRDNVEHLIMIGGPNDVLVESEIVRAPAQAQIAPQRAQRPGENTRAAVAPPERNVARALPAPEPVQAPAPQQQREPEPQQITPAAFRNAFPPRPAARPAPAANNPPPPPPAARRAPEPAAAAARPTRAEEPAEPAAPPAKPKAEIDPLYADIERKLGEALSRPASTPPTPPAPTRSAPPPPPPARSFTPPPPKPAASTPPPAPRRAPEPPAPKAGRNHLDALEDEMASLLGRDRAT